MMKLENKTVEIDGSTYEFTDGMLLQEEGNRLLITAESPEGDTKYRLAYTRLKGSTSEEILEQALLTDGVRLKNAEEVVVEDPILQTYDLYEFADVEQFN